MERIVWRVADGVKDLRERAEIYFALKELTDALGAELSQAGVRAYAAAAEREAAADRDDQCPACGALFAHTWNPNKERWCNRCQSWFPDPRFNRAAR
jgi:hypothetical protein